uniref:Laminin G domain-containing protein n=1 Tax=Labrus bergylta TaxID=56723 RepID=A0A3Q3GUW2_9LABR
HTCDLIKVTVWTHINDWFILALKDGIPLMQISKEEMLVSVMGGPKLNDGKWHTVSPQMDGCVREGSWLNLSVPWEAEAGELWPCYQHIQPGSYFPGTGFAIFNTSGGTLCLTIQDFRECFKQLCIIFICILLLCVYVILFPPQISPSWKVMGLNLR